MSTIEDKIELHAPAGNLDCLRAAADCGADAVYFGFNTPSNLRNFRGINFSRAEAEQGVDYLHRAGKKALITVNSYPQSTELPICREAVDQAAAIHADEVILSDLALLEYTRSHYPHMGISLSVQAGACNSALIGFYVEHFGINRVILPRVLTIEEIARLRMENPRVQLEVFGFGSLCINYEGQCGLSSYITGESTNTIGTCTTPRFLSFHQADGMVTARINGRAIQHFSCSEIEKDSPLSGGLPREEISQWGNHFLINRRQLCKAMYTLETGEAYQMNDFVYLNTLGILRPLIRAGIDAVKIEGRQRNVAYVRDITSLFREAIDLYYRAPSQYREQEAWFSLCRRQFPDIAVSTTCYLGR